MPRIIKTGRPESTSMPRREDKEKTPWYLYIFPILLGLIAIGVLLYIILRP